MNCQGIALKCKYCKKILYFNGKCKMVDNPKTGIVTLMCLDCYEKRIQINDPITNNNKNKETP